MILGYQVSVLLERISVVCLNNRPLKETTTMARTHSTVSSALERSRRAIGRCTRLLLHPSPHLKEEPQEKTSMILT